MIRAAQTPVQQTLIGFGWIPPGMRKTGSSVPLPSAREWKEGKSRRTCFLGEGPAFPIWWAEEWNGWEIALCPNFPLNKPVPSTFPSSHHYYYSPFLCISSQKETIYNTFPLCSAVVELNDSSREDNTFLPLPRSQPLPWREVGRRCRDKTDCHSSGGKWTRGGEKGQRIWQRVLGGLSLRGPRNVGGDICKYQVVFHPLGSPIVFSALCPSKGDVLQREMNHGVP